ncbi:hypothetical protein [Variovorax sp. RA8]|uniref:hypothetical protein n=1 Tax=Variovorax sp. (strain JCM 16519 / RA8) TaxID=662548 RepID=UPI000B1F089A|nr:hypothetical protein [Variovorax sp. RA8]VTU34391.1 hypothetical protein RA8CHR_04964 [Variovorax sp. RA8]
METKRRTTMDKIDDWFDNQYLSEGHASGLFSQEHIDVLNEKLRPHNVWINMKTPQGDAIDTTWYAVEKLKVREPVTGWKKIGSFFSNPVEETLLNTNNTKKLQNFLNSRFSKELGYDTSKPAEPVREMPEPTYRPKLQSPKKPPVKGRYLGM